MGENRVIETMTARLRLCPSVVKMTSYAVSYEPTSNRRVRIRNSNVKPGQRVVFLPLLRIRYQLVQPDDQTVPFRRS
jgi:hypothetical protein